MADTMKITELTQAESLSISDLVECAVPAQNNTYVSRRFSLAQLSNFIGNSVLYTTLTSTDKTIIGALNEILLDLANYYLKSETYSKTEVNELIAGILGSRFKVVQTLPVSDINPSTIYLVPKQDVEQDDIYDEYVYIVEESPTPSHWEKIGTTQIDLSDYVTDAELTTALNNYVTNSALTETLQGYATTTALGNKVDKVAGKGLSTEDYTTTDKLKLAGIEDGAQVNSVTGVKGDSESNYRTGNVNITKSNVGLSNVPNVTTDNQTPTVTEASTRANLATGDTLKTIVGKIKKYFADLKTVAFTGSYNDLTNKPSIPSGQVQSDWSQTDDSEVDFIKNKPIIPTVNNATLTIQKNGTTVKTFTANASSDVTANIVVPTKTSDLTNDSNFVASSSLASVATSGDYGDLLNKPTIPTVNNAKLTIQRNGTTVKTFTANASSDVTANISVPTKTSDLSNDSNFVSDASYVHTDVNFTSTLKSKLDGIASGAEVNVQSDWNATSGDAFIKNKPTIPAAQIQSDWNQTTDSAVDFIKNKPTIPTVNNKTITLKQNGTTVDTFTTNQSSNKSIDFLAAVNNELMTEDLDSVKVAGFYVGKSGNTCTNKPSGVNQFGLYVIRLATTNTNYWKQTLVQPQTVANGGSKTYSRSQYNGTWTSWVVEQYTDTTYTAGTGISISNANAISNSGATGVKGNAESTYRTGNVNLTPANIGALGTSNPTVQNGFQQKLTAVDAVQSNNGVTSDQWTNFHIRDTNDRIIGSVRPIVYKNGDIATELSSRNWYNAGTEEAPVPTQRDANSLRVITKKNGTHAYAVSSPTAFRTAINLEWIYFGLKFCKTSQELMADSCVDIFLKIAGINKSYTFYLPMTALVQTSDSSDFQLTVGYYKTASDNENVTFRLWHNSNKVKIRCTEVIQNGTSINIDSVGFYVYYR